MYINIFYIYKVELFQKFIFIQFQTTPTLDRPFTVYRYATHQHTLSFPFVKILKTNPPIVRYLFVLNCNAINLRKILARKFIFAILSCMRIAYKQTCSIYENIIILYYIHSYVWRLWINYVLQFDSALFQRKTSA